MSTRPPHLELLLWGALALASTLVISWPMATQLGSHTLLGLQNPDVVTSVWWYQQIADAVAGFENPFRTDQLLWPLGTHIGANIWNLGAPLAAVPLSWIYGPVGVLNAAAIAFTALTGTLAALGTRRLGGDRVSAAAACVVGATLAFSVVEVASGRGEQGLLAPVLLSLLGWARLRERPGDRRLAALTGLALGWAGVVYWMGGYMLAVLMGGDLALRALRRRVGREVLLDMVWAGGAAALVAGPFLIPVVVGSSQGADHGLLEASLAGGLDGAVALPWVLEGPFAPEHTDASRRWPLLAAPLLLLGAWRLRGPARWLAFAGLASGVFALGRLVWLPFLVGGEALSLPLPHRALDALPGMDRYWWPYRWSMLLLPCAALVTGALLSTLKRGPLRIAAAVLVAGWSLYEGAAMLRRSPSLQPLVQNEARIPQIFRRLGEEPGQHPILQLPTRKVTAGMIHWQLWHQQPIDSSIGWQLPGAVPSSWEPEMRKHALLEALLFEGESRRDWSVEDAGGFHYVVLYTGPGGRYEPGEPGPEAWSRKVEGLLGPPLSRADGVSVWALPGAPTLR
jgi:hypothetical protein